MKILLDIDGVMIPAKPWQTYQMEPDGFGVFSKFSIEGLNKIIEKSIDPEIVLTTSHKHNFSLKAWQNMFSFRGITKTQISRLETNSLEISRMEEIKIWYSKNLNEQFIIIDDDKSLNDLDYNIKEDHLILTQSTIGLNKQASEQAINKILNIQRHN